MKLKVTNYRNIASFEFEIVPSKINCIFGISGSGKSSIVKAFSSDDLLKDKRFSSSNNPEAMVDNQKLNSNEFGVFNADTITSVFVERDNLVYEVLIDNKQSYQKAQEKLEKLVSDLRDALNNEEITFQNYEEFVGLCGAKKLNKGDILPKKSPLNSIIRANEKLSSSRFFEEISKMNPENIAWMTQGSKLIDSTNNKCPFCKKKMSKRYLRKVARYQEYEQKSMAVFKKYSGSYHADESGNDSIAATVLKQMEKDAIKKSIACQQFRFLNDLLENLFDETSNWKNISEGFSVKKELFDVFPNLKHPFDELKKHVRLLGGLYKNAQLATKKLLSKRLVTINNWINRFGIPYKIKATYKKDKITEYKLVHTADSLENDSSQRLSTGEQNIISLLFFVLDAQKKDYKIIFIDDPVSSYDECRRSQIMSLFCELLSGKTLLILSHDSVFAKYVCNDIYHRGKIIYFENYDSYPKSCNITFEDFGDFNSFIEEHAKSVSEYYRKIICLRMLYEGKYRSSAYSYLSAILHGSSKATIVSQLKALNLTEETVVSSINKEYPGINLVNYDESNLTNINLDEFTFFEKVFFLRETLNQSKEDKELIRDLSDLVHLNRQLKVCLNPFKFVFCAPSTYHSVIQRANGTKSLHSDGETLMAS